MGQFKYKAKDKSGSYVYGTVEADNSDSAVGEVQRLGVTPIAIRPAGNFVNFGITERWKSTVRLPEIVMLCRQLYALTKAGVPIIRAIGGLAESTEHYGLKKSLQKLNSDLISGKSLTQAMKEQPRVFNSLFVSLVNVGENTGRLEDVFAQLSEYFNLEHETRKQLTSAMRYPFIVIIFLAGALVVLNIMVIPVFSQMFAKFGVELPLATRILIGTSNFFVNYWPLLAVFAIGIPIFIAWMLRIKKIRYIWDGLKLKIPVIGGIMNRALLGRFCRSFALMVRSGVQLNMALTLVASAIDNKYLEKKVLNMRKSIEQGNSLSVVSVQSCMFTPLVLQMFAVGDETGRVDDLMIEAASYYEHEVDYELKSLTTKIEPILLLFVAIMVAVLALGIFTPMWDMYGAMQGHK